MAISGRKDDDHSQKGSLQKAQDNGFGQKGVAGRKKKDATATFEERAAERMEKLVDKSLDALERAMSSGNEKTAADAAYKFTRLYYNPDQKIVVEGTNPAEIHYNLQLQQDNLSETERKALESFQSFLREGIVEDEALDIVDAEIIEDASDERREDSRTEGRTEGSDSK